MSEVFFGSFIGTLIYGNGSMKPGRLSKGMKYLVGLFCDTLYLVICDKLVLLITCDDGKLIIDKNITCWEGEHLFYATICLIFLGFYIPLCTLIRPMFGSIEKGGILETRPLISFLAVVKTILLICVIIGNATSFSIIYMTCCLISILIMIYWTVSSGMLNPHYPFRLNFIRSGFYLCGLYGGFLALVVHPDHQQYFLLGGVFVIETIAYCIGGIGTTHVTTEEIAEQGDQTRIEEINNASV